MYDISSAIKAFEDMLKSLFDLLKTNKEKQTDTAVLREKKDLKKATNLAEEIILNTDNFFVWVARLCYDIMDFRQRRQFVHFLKRHKKLKKYFEKVN